MLQTSATYHTVQFNHVFLFSSALCFRCKLLEMHLDQVEQFYQTLLLLTERSENFLSDLRSSSSVDISNLEAAVTELKVINPMISFYTTLEPLN